jgi:cytochrome oxidase assembly protein ShyY1
VKHWLRPGLLGLHVLAVAAVGLCVVMGLWQLGLYEGRQGDAQRGARHEVVPLAEVWQPGEAFTSDLTDKRVSVEGRFADDDLRVTRDDGSTWLVTPFVIGDHALLIVRGEGERAPASDATELDVVLEPSESGGRALAPDDDGVPTTDAISVPALLNDLPQRLYGGYGIALTDTGLPLVDPPAPDVSWTVGMRNLAYALQWWVFGAFALFMWWRMATESVTATEARMDDPDRFTE